MKHLRAHWISLLTFACLGVTGAWVGILLSPPTWVATSTLYVSTNESGRGIEPLAATVYAQSRIASYAQLATSDIVLARTIGDLHLSESPDQLADSVVATPQLNSLLIEIAATTDSASKSREIADSIGSNLRDVIDSPAQNTGLAKSSLIRLSFVSRAVAVPDYPKPALFLVAGGVLGVILWFGISLLAGLAATRITNRAGVLAVTDAPILAGVALAPSAYRIAMSVVLDPAGEIAESTRQLRSNLKFTAAEGSADRSAEASAGRALVITSSVPREGKTTTAVNLALAMAAAGDRVLLIDADLRRPRVADVLNLDGHIGLTDVLRRRVSLANGIIESGQDVPLSVLPAGVIPPNPSELLGSPAMRALLADVESRFDQVVIDAPPLLPATDGAMLGAMTGGAILVAGMGRISGDQLLQSLSRLKASGCHLHGLVLTMLPARDTEWSEAREPELRSAVNS